MHTTRSIDDIRAHVLDEMERAAKFRLWAIIAATVCEVALLGLALVLVDWSVRWQAMLFIMFVLTYSMICLGLIALGGHITRNTGRILTALDRAD